MRDYRLRTDLERVVIDGFALPLGFTPDASDLRAPVQGYTVTYNVGEGDEPDTYAFHIVVSHERLRPILRAAFEMLPDEVFGIIEVGSRDAYRSTDTFLGDDLISKSEFMEVWKRFEPFLLEDGAIAAGANADEPFIEVFLDQWKGVTIHVPGDQREEVEQTLRDLDLHEVAETWDEDEDEKKDATRDVWDDALDDKSTLRSVLDTTDEFMPDLDELLLQLRESWQLELNVDPRTNVDESGRSLGSTLWHAVVIVEDAQGKQTIGAYADIWATAASLEEMEKLAEEAIDKHPEWSFGDIYTIDRVAFDERPDELGALKPNDRRSRVHLVSFDRWNEPPAPPGTPEHSQRNA